MESSHIAAVDDYTAGRQEISSLHLGFQATLISVVLLAAQDIRYEMRRTVRLLPKVPDDQLSLIGAE